MIIELQGEHHYRPVRFAGMSLEKAKKQFKSRLIKDKIKEDFCIKNNYRFLKITFKQINEIENIIKQNL